MGKEYKYKNNLFSCYINARTVHLRVNKKTGISDLYIQDYNTDTISNFKSFESEKSALNFVSSFKKSAHGDANSLWALLDALDKIYE